MTSASLRIRAADLWKNGRNGLHNRRARLWPVDVDFVVLALSGALPEYIPPPPAWQKWLPVPIFGGGGGPSLSGLRNILDQIALDPRPVGVVFNLTGLGVGWATAQSLRDAIGRLRAKGKQVVAYAAQYEVINYYVATAADSIVAAPPAAWDVTGLRAELTFLRDAFEAWGVQAEVVNVSPYKTAGDTLARSDISPEHRAMIEWMMNGRFEAVVEAIAAARRLEPARVRELIDHAPYLAAEARTHGLLDALLYEDELADYLGPQRPPARKPRWSFRWPWRRRPAEAPPEKPRAVLKRWAQVWPGLRRPIRWRSGQRIAIISLEGAIVAGRTPQTPPLPDLPIPLPFVGESLAGSETIAQHFREAEKDGSVAAVVFHVNSPGGSALASDLIWREMERVRRKKPVVVYMDNVAASGGYYVAASADHIVAQPLTVTGSIGVISLKFVTAGLYEKLKAHRVVIQRGANAGLYADDAPFTPELRAVAEAQTDAYYAAFKRVVMQGRKLEEAAFDPVAGGRVWLGQQALEHKLVDQLGDIQAAIDKARDLARLPADRWTPPVWYHGQGDGLLAPAFPSESPVTTYLRLLQSLARERVWMIDPFILK